MAERTNIPTSPACGQWETLLADALDGQLRPEDEATFSTHMAGCKACSALFDEARRGREWLNFLSDEPEVPAGLLDRILAQTGPGQAAGFGLTGGDNLVPAIPGGVALKGRPVVPAWQKPGFMGYVRRFAEPRLMMTAAMAFFSIALTLNLTGVKLTELRLADLKPSTVRSLLQRRITMASTPIVRYYDHLRLVYEVQTRMREFKRDNETAPQSDSQPGAGESKHTQPAPKGKEGGSRVDPPQQSVSPALIDPDLLETAYCPSNGVFPQSPLLVETGLTHSGGSTAVIDQGKKERSSAWTA